MLLKLLLAVSPEEQKVVDEITKEEEEIKKNQEEVKKLMDEMATKIELTCGEGRQYLTIVRPRQSKYWRIFTEP